ncbi:MAG TPA: hypothetical protein VG799_03745 [Gemmatimonadota bacterium]|nr:hypothetical protein [Gemmatimonadota bacterium]
MYRKASPDRVDQQPGGGTAPAKKGRPMDLLARALMVLIFLQAFSLTPV